MTGISLDTAPRVMGLCIPKPSTTAEQCEDAFSPGPGIAAISDGAGSMFESRRWARILADAFVSDPPFDRTSDHFLSWVDSAAALWTGAISRQDLNPLEGMKASEGSAATLAGVSFPDAIPGADGGVWRCLAVGDSCLFQISEDVLSRALPLGESSAFRPATTLLSTQRAKNPRDIRPFIYEGRWRAGDELLLLTDAIAKWFLEEVEASGRPWDLLAEHNQQSLPRFVADLMAAGQMGVDDVTVLSISFGAAHPALAGVNPPVSSTAVTAPARRPPVAPLAPGRSSAQSRTPQSGPVTPAAHPAKPRRNPSRSRATSPNRTAPPNRAAPPNRTAPPKGSPSPNLSAAGVGAATPNEETGPSHAKPPKPLPRRIARIAMVLVVLAIGYAIGSLAHRRNYPHPPQIPVITINVARSEAHQIASRMADFGRTGSSRSETSTGQVIAMTEPQNAGRTEIFYAVVVQHLTITIWHSGARLPISGQPATARGGYSTIKPYTRDDLIKLVMIKKDGTWKPEKVDVLDPAIGLESP